MGWGERAGRSRGGQGRPPKLSSTMGLRVVRVTPPSESRSVRDTPPLELHLLWHSFAVDCVQTRELS